MSWTDLRDAFVRDFNARRDEWMFTLFAYCWLSAADFVFRILPWPLNAGIGFGFCCIAFTFLWRAIRSAWRRNFE